MSAWDAAIALAPYVVALALVASAADVANNLISTLATVALELGGVRTGFNDE